MLNFCVIFGFVIFSINGVNKHYGTPTNPAAHARVPGGSCSGAAVAVAAKLVDFSLGEFFFLYLLIAYLPLTIPSMCTIALVTQWIISMWSRTCLLLLNFLSNESFSFLTFFFFGICKHIWLLMPVIMSKIQ